MDLDKRILYRTLGVSSTSSKEDVELAYRRFMMRHHPNEGEAAVDPSKDPAVLANLARNILSDPEKRKEYDNSFRIFAPEDGGGEKLPDCATFILFTIFLSVLAIRVYGIVGWNYYVVFVPLWVLDSWLVCSKCLLFYLSVQMISGLKVLLDDKLETSSQLTKSLLKESFKGLFNELLHTALIIAFQILVARKANDPSSTSASLVFVPLFAMEGWSFLGHFAAVFVQYFSGGSLLPLAFKITFTIIKLWWHIIKLSLAVLVMLRIDNVINCSWNVVFIPLYISGFKKLLEITFLAALGSHALHPETRQPFAILIGSSIVKTVLFVAVICPLTNVLAKILDGKSDAASYILFLLITLCTLALCSIGCLCFSISLAFRKDLDENLNLREV